MKLGRSDVHLVGAILLLCTSTPAQTTTRVSVDSTGLQADDASYPLAVSQPGRYVTFTSSATNLVSGDTNGWVDVFVHDLQGGLTSRVSVDSAGVEGNNGSGGGGSISLDGRYVAFQSAATNLVPGDTNQVNDIFVRDRQTGTTTRVSVSSTGTEADWWSGWSSISGDGRYVAFESAATNLVAGDTNGANDVFVHDRSSGATTRVSLGPGGAQGTGESGHFGVSIRHDGRFVAFESAATNLVNGDTNGWRDIFVRDRLAETTMRVSVASNGAESDNYSHFPAISADGLNVAFESPASNLVTGDTNGLLDIFVHNIPFGTTTRVSVDSAGAQADNACNGASISHNGRLVAFWSLATNLVPGDTNGAADVFVNDRLNGTTRRVSVTSAGGQASGGSFYCAMSPGGCVVAFASGATDLVTGDTNARDDVFARNDLPPYPIEFCAGDGLGTPCPCGNNSIIGGGEGCLGSHGSGGRIYYGTGFTQLSNDTLVITGVTMTNSTCLYFQGMTQLNNGLGLVFGDGLRCVVGSVVRLGIKTNVGGASQYPDPGDVPISVKGNITTPGVRTYQCWYRNAASFCTPVTFNLTNGLQITWLP